MPTETPSGPMLLAARHPHSVRRSLDNRHQEAVGRLCIVTRMGFSLRRSAHEEGLRVPPKRRKRHRLGDSTPPAERLEATCRDQVWALDYQFDCRRTNLEAPAQR